MHLVTKQAIFDCPSDGNRNKYILKIQNLDNEVVEITETERNHAFANFP